MKTELIPINDPLAIEKAASIISKGGLIAYPTDTVYGLSSNPFQQVSIEKIFIAKGRDFNKAIAILIASLSQLPLVTSGLTPTAKRLANRFWPGALTLMVPILSGLPDNLSPLSTIGIRMPNHPFALSLLNRLGPLATTSANISGHPDARTAQEVKSQLEGQIDLILDGGECTGGIPSTVVDCTRQKPAILREGAISRALIEKELGI
jgi:L-threonylcarbamoyladenylate synthase